MSVRTVSSDTLEALAFESGQTIHIGTHTATVTIDGVVYVARLEVA